MRGAVTSQAFASDQIRSLICAREGWLEVLKAGGTCTTEQLLILCACEISGIIAQNSSNRVRAGGQRKIQAEAHC